MSFIFTLFSSYLLEKNWSIIFSIQILLKNIFIIVECNGIELQNDAIFYNTNQLIVVSDIPVKICVEINFSPCLWISFLWQIHLEMHYKVINLYLESDSVAQSNRKLILASLFSLSTF